MGGGCCVSNHPVRDFFNDIFCGDYCCVGNASGPSESERHARKIADELAEMKEKNEKKSSEKEKEIMDSISESMDVFLAEVDQWNEQRFSGESLNINTDMLRRKNEALKNSVVGCIGNAMNARLVQTDKELSIILEERDDKKRKENFDKFTGKIKRQALKKLKIEIEKTVQAQSDVISTEIKTRQKEIDLRLEESLRELMEIMEVKNKNNLELEKKQIAYMYQSSLCDFLIAEAEG